MTLNITEVTATDSKDTDTQTAIVLIAGVHIHVVIGADGQIALVHRQESGALETVVVSTEDREIDADVLQAVVRLGRK